MKAFFLLLLSIPAFASWHYNEDGGFGIYQPEGWGVVHQGRSSRLTGPKEDRAQSEIFLGSDWVSHADSLPALEEYVKKMSGDPHPVPVKISELPGFRVGSARKGAMYLLRIRENVIVIQYNLRGSREQIEEGETMLSSIEVRTKGNEYP